MRSLAWVWFFRDLAAHPSLTPEELARLSARSRRDAKEAVPWLPLFRRMLPVTAVALCYGWNLWLFLSWIPSFFYQNYQQDLKQSAFYLAGVFAGGVVGDTVGGLWSDRILRRSGDVAAARRNVIVTGMLGGLVFLLPVIMVHDVSVAAALLALAFFCIELVVAPIWSVPMDIAPRHAGSTSGMMNFGFGAPASSRLSCSAISSTSPAAGRGRSRARWCCSSRRRTRLPHAPRPAVRIPLRSGEG
jgi:hypothetical protein